MSPQQFAHQKGIWDLAAPVLENDKFYTWSASSLINNDPSKPRLHHYGKGGLRGHTFEVIDLCAFNTELYPTLDKIVLFLAALYHDIGKIWDYEERDGEWYSVDHKKEIHHVSRSALVWHETCIKHPNPYADKVLHCILSHHGRQEWGSPVAPRSKEAWLLHLCDAISARMDDCERIKL